MAETALVPRAVTCTTLGTKFTVCYPKPTAKPLFDGLVRQVRSNT